MRILIATGIYPPEIGGPAFYAESLAQAFTKKGHDVRVVSYGALKRLPSGLRHLAYAAKLLTKALSCDAVIALDTFSVALPAVVVGILARKRVVIRTGGDFVWEHYVERTKNMIPLPLFYESKAQLSRKERVICFLTKFALRNSYVVFSTEMQRKVWKRPYNLLLERTAIINNAAESALQGSRPPQKNFLWHVRPIAMKNGTLLREAFLDAQKKYPEILLEEGTMPKERLLERMRDCYAVILPSLTEISPNYILDALRFHKPFIMDAYSGLAQWLAPYGLLVDPLSKASVTAAIEELASDAGYVRASEKAAAFHFERSYDAVADDFLKIL